MVWGKASKVSQAPFPSYYASNQTNSEGVHAPCITPHSREESDLCAQWKAASAAETSSNWAKWASISGILSTIAVVAALYMALDANRIARRTASQQLRAYVSIDSIGFENIAIGAYVRCNVKMRNFGQTPAYKFDIVTYATFDQTFDQDINLTAQNTNPTPSTLSPGASGHAYPRLGTLWTPFLDHLYRTGKLRLVVFGYAEYTDIFGVNHRTDIKVYNDASTPVGTTIQYPTGNRAT